MARVYGIQKRLPKYGADEKETKEIIGDGELTGVIKRMEDSLAPDVARQILDSCACLGNEEFRKKCEKTGKELAGKSMEEKICCVNERGSGSETVALNDDGTLTGTLRWKDGEKYKCRCVASVKKGVLVSDLASEGSSHDGSVMPLLYCFCCAGGFRRHLQLQLGVELKTKEIVSSPINSKGEKPCEFIFDIVK